MRCHKLLPLCNCKQKCLEQLGEPRRNEIFEDFWKMSYNERKSWIFFRVEVTATNRHRPSINESSSSRTMRKLFFLRTLEYSTNTVLKVIFENTDPSALQPARDKRGRHKAANKISGDQLNLIRSHIYSHHPAVSHYRRAHAPNRLYLSPELFNDSSPMFSVDMEKVIMLPHMPGVKQCIFLPD